MSRYENHEIKNNVFGTLSAPISSLATTIQLGDGQGQRFSENMLATLENIENGKVMKREIVLITAINGDTLTVTRKYAPCPASDDANSQSQTSFSFDVSDTINVYITAEHLDIVNTGIKNLETEGNDRMKVLPAISGTPLAIDIMPGNFRCADDNIVYAGTTDQILTDNATNYIMIDGTATLQISTTDRDTRYTRLAKVTTLNGEITDIEDWRLDTIGGNLGGLTIHPLTEKTVPAPTDELVIADSADSFNNKRISYANLSPASLVRFVTLGEAVTAGDCQGACYFGTDWKVYKSNVAGHNYCDGIVIDSGVAGDRVRMIVAGFVPCLGFTGTEEIVTLSYTSTNTNTGYGDYIKLGNQNYNNIGVTYGMIQIGGVPSILFSGRQSSWGPNEPLFPMYGVAGTIQLGVAGSYTSSTTRYVEGSAGQYDNLTTTKISGCQIGIVVPGGFIFDPKPIETFVGMYKSLSSAGETTAIQAKFDGTKTAGIFYQSAEMFYTSFYVLESPDGTNRIQQGQAFSGYNSGDGTYGNMFTTIRFSVRKGYYYKLWGGRRNTTIMGLVSNT